MSKLPSRLICIRFGVRAQRSSRVSISGVSCFVRDCGTCGIANVSVGRLYQAYNSGVGSMEVTQVELGPFLG